MAWYAYKTVLALIPQDFKDQWEKSRREETGREPEWSADYDGDYWLLAASYIEHLRDLVSRCEKALTSVIEPENKA
jgi:hypothetical protein